MNEHINKKQMRKSLFREAARHLRGLKQDYRERTRYASLYYKELSKVIFLLENHWGGAVSMTAEQIEKHDSDFEAQHNVDVEEVDLWRIV